MSISDYVTIISVLISFLSVLFVVMEFRRSTNQRKVESQIRLYDINRELLSLGFSHPELFQILMDKETNDPAMERRYLQLWLNQLALVHAFQLEGAFRQEVGEGFERDFQDFIVLKNMRNHWQIYGKYYPASFQERVNAILNKAGPTDA